MVALDDWCALDLAALADWAGDAAGGFAVGEDRYRCEGCHRGFARRWDRDDHEVDCPLLMGNPPGWPPEPRMGEPPASGGASVDESLLS